MRGSREPLCRRFSSTRPQIKVPRGVGSGCPAVAGPAFWPTVGRPSLAETVSFLLFAVLLLDRPIDEAFRVASERAPGGPGSSACFPVLGRGAAGGVRCSGWAVSSPARFPSRARCVVLVLPPPPTPSQKEPRPRPSFALSRSAAGGGGRRFHGLVTEPGCVTAARPREPSGVLNHARRRCWPRSVCPRGCRPRAALGRWGGRAFSVREGKKGKAAGGAFPLRRGRWPLRLVPVPPPPPAAERAAPARALGRRVAPASAGRCLL